MRLARGWRWGSVLARLEPRGVKLPTVASAPAWLKGGDGAHLSDLELLELRLVCNDGPGSGWVGFSRAVK